jgi:hypothetical protein
MLPVVCRLLFGVCRYALSQLSSSLPQAGPTFRDGRMAEGRIVLKAETYLVLMRVVGSHADE